MNINIIEVNLNEKKDYVNPFNHKRISTELSDYILNECKPFHPNDVFEIHIYHKFFLTKDEKKELVDIIRENYGMDIHELCILSNKRRSLNLFALLIGIVFLFFQIFINVVPIVSELILIFGWVFIWEGIYNIMFDGLKNRVMIRRLKQLTSCKICFYEKEK